MTREAPVLPTLPTLADERRSLTSAQAGLTIRADDAAGRRFHGLAAVYGVRAPIGNPKTWGFFEEFAPGTFTASLAADDQRFLIDHDTYYVVSRRSAGTLELTESSRGVEVDSALDEDLTYVRDLIANLANGNITGMSIGFRVPAGGDDWSTIEVEEEAQDGKIRVYTADLRTVRKAELIEGSAVTFPAFADTEASLRHAVIPALARRGEHDAVARRAAHRPELAELLSYLPAPPAADPRGEPEHIRRSMRALATRYRLPA